MWVAKDTPFIVFRKAYGLATALLSGFLCPMTLTRILMVLTSVELTKCYFFPNSLLLLVAFCFRTLSLRLSALGQVYIQ